MTDNDQIPCEKDTRGSSISDGFSELKITSSAKVLSRSRPSRSISDPCHGGEGGGVRMTPAVARSHQEQGRVHGGGGNMGQGESSDVHNTGIMTRIRGFKSDIMKRVSRVMSDEEIRNLKTIRQEVEQPAVSELLRNQDPLEDPNLKQRKSEQSLHDVYKQLKYRGITSNIESPPPTPPDIRGPLSPVDLIRKSPVSRRKTPYDMPRAKETELQKKVEETNTEVFNVLQALKEGKSTDEIECSRNIVERSVTLTRTSDFKSHREDQGGQFGVRIVGGKKTLGGLLCAFVASIVPGSPASYSPDIHEGDLVLRWNDNMLIGMTYEECQQCLDDCDSVDLVVSNFLRGSYRRYKPRTSASSSRSGSVESILRGTTQKWLTLTRRGMMTRLCELREDASGTSGSMEEQSLLEETTKIKVELKVMYVGMDNRLSVHLIQAANIPFRERNDGLDVFCKMYLLPDSGAECKRRSKTAAKTYNPYWNQHFEFQHVPTDELSQKRLEVTLMTYHWLQKDQPLGQIEINLGDKRVLSGQSTWYYLRPPPSPSPSPSLESPSSPHGDVRKSPRGGSRKSPRGGNRKSTHDDRRKLSSDTTESGQIASRSISDLVKEKVSIQHRITFSTFDSKKDIVADIRRSASDSTKPPQPPKQKSVSPHPDDHEDSCSDNVFSSTTIQTHLSNIKEVDSDELRRPIDVRGSPRRKAKVIRNRSQTKEDTRPGDAGDRKTAASEETLRSAYETSTISPESSPSKLKPSPTSKLKPPIRCNSEDLMVTTKHRVLPKPPAPRGGASRHPPRVGAEDPLHLLRVGAGDPAGLVLPVKKPTSPCTLTPPPVVMHSIRETPFSETKVILTAPSSEECTGNSSTDSDLPSKKLNLRRPSPEGRLLIGTGDHSSELGPGQIAVTSQGDIPGSLVLTLGIDKNMLTLEVVQANNLPIRASGTPPDTYVKTYVLLDDHRSHKEKTTTVRGNSNPVFNERITYIVNPHNKTLQVMCWDEVGTLRRNVFLGEIMIDLGYIMAHGPLQGRYKLFQSCSESKPP